MGLFALAFNLLLGYAGMVSFGHAAFYGLGAYACGLLLKKAGAPFAVAFLAAPVVAAAGALIFGLLCIRLTRIYFSMLTLAFSQIVWATALKWYSLTGGDNGLVAIPVPEVARRAPRLLSLHGGVHGAGDVGPLASRQCAVRTDAPGHPGERRARRVRRHPRQTRPARGLRHLGRDLRPGRRALRALQPRGLPRLRLLDQVGRGAAHDAPWRPLRLPRARRWGPASSSCSTPW